MVNLSELLHQAEHNGAAGWSWCFVTPEQARELITALNSSRANERSLVIDLNAALGKLERIGELAHAARLAWIDNDRREMQRLIEEIEGLAGDSANVDTEN